MNTIRSDSDSVAQIEFEANTDELLKEGLDRKKAALKANRHVTKSEQIADIRSNRADERDADRAEQVESGQEGRTRKSRTAQPDAAEEEYIAPVTHMGEWERVRKEKMQNRGED